MTEGLGPTPSRKKIEAQKETGPVLRREDIEMTKMSAMIMIAQKGGNAMKEMWGETGRGSVIGIGSILETVIVTEIGIVIGNVTGIAIGMTGIDMLNIIDTGSVNQIMMRNGTGEDLLGLTVSHEYHMRKSKGQELGMLNMERGGD